MSIPINKTLDEIRTEMFARIDTVQDEYAAKGWLPVRLNLNKGVFRGLIELWCWGLHQLYQFLSYVLRQAFPTSADGAWLDLHCLQVGINRLAAIKAGGKVYFTRAETVGNVSIPAGRVVRTLPDGAGRVYRFVTTAAAVLPDGATAIAVAVEAEEYGAAANVVAGQIVEIATTVAGVDGVENRSDWLTSEGADRESDAKLRERYVLAWMGVGSATAAAYEAWARSVPGVVAATVLGHVVRGPGTVDVIVRGAGGVPSDDLLVAVDAVVQAQRPINDDALVRGPVPVAVRVEAELVLVSGDPDAIALAAVGRVAALFTDPAPVPDIAPLGIGESLMLDRLIAEIMAVPGIKKINFVSPVADVAVPTDGMAVLSAVEFSTAWTVAA